jgi:hypothetical protein
VQLQHACEPGSGETSASAIFKIQPANVYLKDVNGLQLCVGQADGFCERDKYNFVEYKGGATIRIDRGAISDAIKKLSTVSDVVDLEKAQ